MVYRRLVVATVAIAALTALALVAGPGVVSWAGSPASPINVSPPDGATAVPAHASLCVEVHDSNGDPLDVTFFARELTGEPAEDFAIVVLPDTQYYAQTFPEVFHAQTSWIVENREARNIVFVTHVGDVVHLASVIAEWNNADAAMSRLEDPTRTVWPDGIPYGVSVGNHDQFINDYAGRIEFDAMTTTNFNLFFGESRFAGRSYYGGHYGSANDNSYQIFSAGGMDFIIVHHEFDSRDHALRDAVLDWTDQLLKDNPGRRAIITSHSLLCTFPGWPNGTQCPNSLDAPFSGQGQATYDALKDNPHLFLMLCGHAGASGVQPRRADLYDGRTIHTLLSNYQRSEPCPFRCGNGWMRIMTFSPARDEIVIESYSPWLDRVWDGANPDHHNFTLPYDMNGGLHFEQVGSVSQVPSGMTACLDWTGRTQDSVYEWYASVEGTDSTVTGPYWTFDSDGRCNFGPDCDDGDICTLDSCVGASCQHSKRKDCCAVDADCDDDNPCTDDACSENTCSPTYNSRPCYDGDECTVGDVCANAICAGTPMVCDDGNECTNDSCLEGTCRFDYAPTPQCCGADADCDDGDYCTTDSCKPNLSCRNTPVRDCCTADVQCGDADSCTRDLCIQRNTAALRLDTLYDHVTMSDYRISEITSQPPGTTAREFTVECWFKWSGDGEVATTSGYPWGDPPDVDGIEAYPLVTKGIKDQDVHRDNPSLNGKKSVNYFLGIAESGHVLAADFEEHPSGLEMSRNHPVYGSTPIAPGVWYHGAATYDGDCWQLYLDGQPETDGTNCPGQPAAFESLHYFAVGVGQGWEGWIEGSFLGLIDEVRIWNRALSEEEILANMYTQIEAASDLLGRWGFDEPGNRIVNDTTGNQNHGIVVNASFETSDIVNLGEPYCESRTPSEVMGVNIPEGEPARLRWLDSRSGFLYDVANGMLSDLRSSGGTALAQCRAEDLVETVHLDERVPSPGDGYYYIIREDGSCGGGTYGFATSGEERLPLDACRSQ